MRVPTLDSPWCGVISMPNDNFKTSAFIQPSWTLVAGMSSICCRRPRRMPMSACRKASRTGLSMEANKLVKDLPPQSRLRPVGASTSIWCLA